MVNLIHKPSLIFFSQLLKTYNRVVIHVIFYDDTLHGQLFSIDKKITFSFILGNRIHRSCSIFRIISHHIDRYTVSTFNKNSVTEFPVRPSVQCTPSHTDTSNLCDSFIKIE